MGSFPLKSFLLCVEIEATSNTLHTPGAVRAAGIIRVLLPGAPTDQALPRFLRLSAWSDLRGELRKRAIEPLVRGIRAASFADPDYTSADDAKRGTIRALDGLLQRGKKELPGNPSPAQLLQANLRGAPFYEPGRRDELQQLCR